MAEFTEIGKHCAVPGCNQQDFLPFKCDCCSGTFCLPHRSYSAHACPSSGAKDYRALVCPLCAKTVRFSGNEDPNRQWEVHSRTDCNPGGHKTKRQKKRCAAPGCRELLGPTNTQRCNSCGQETCLSHRYPDSHRCTGGGSSRRLAAAAAAKRMEAQRPMSLREKAALRRAAASDNTARATADRRRRPTTAGQGAVGSDGGRRERCPQCEASFADVGSLIAHVEAFHSEEREARTPGVGSGGGGGGGGSAAGEQCPICRSHFADVALLVSHVEAMHPGGVGTASGAASSCSIS